MAFALRRPGGAAEGTGRTALGNNNLGWILSGDLFWRPAHAATAYLHAQGARRYIDLTAHTQ